MFLERFFPCVREAAHMGDRMLHQFARSDCGTNCENARTSASLGYLAQPGAASGEKCAMFVLVGNLKLGAGDPNDLHKIPALVRDGFSICHHCLEREKDRKSVGWGNRV